MSFSIELSPEASKDLARLPVDLLPVIRSFLESIAEHPNHGTRPAAPPYPPGMLARAERPFRDVECLIDVVFRYGQDERSIHISRIFAEFI